MSTKMLKSKVGPGYKGLLPQSSNISQSSQLGDSPHNWVALSVYTSDFAFQNSMKRGNSEDANFAKSKSQEFAKLRSECDDQSCIFHEILAY